MSKEIDDVKGNNQPSKIVQVENVHGNLYVGESPEYKVGSVINELLGKIASKEFNFVPINRKPSAKTIIKIKHNNLQSKSHIIKQYLDYSSNIENAYEDINTEITFGKDTILRNLYDLYFSALDAIGVEYLYESIDIEKIRENSDVIVDTIIQRLKNIVYESDNTPQYKEQIDIGVNVVVAHAFIECVIMENPSDDTD